MRNFVIGLIAGSILTVIAAVSFGDLLYAFSDRQLIRDWRQIHLGMKQGEIKELLGEPSYSFKLGKSFPVWAEKSVPKDYHLKHSLIVYTVKLPAPQLLLVYSDKNNKVVFVSSVST